MFCFAGGLVHHRVRQDGQFGELKDFDAGKPEILHYPARNQVTAVAPERVSRGIVWKMGGIKEVSIGIHKGAKLEISAILTK